MLCFDVSEKSLLAKFEWIIKTAQNGLTFPENVKHGIWVFVSDFEICNFNQSLYNV